MANSCGKMKFQHLGEYVLATRKFSAYSCQPRSGEWMKARALEIGKKTVYFETKKSGP